jgi:hypothetical protein
MIKMMRNIHEISMRTTLDIQRSKKENLLQHLDFVSFLSSDADGKNISVVPVRGTKSLAEMQGFFFSNL